MIPTLLRSCTARGHVVFAGGDLDLNLIAQRSGSLPQQRQRGSLDDLLTCAFLEEGRWTEISWPCSTVPGHAGLRNPSAQGGTAILLPGQYRHAYQRGLHKGRPALVQVAPVRVLRDADRDLVLDPGASTFDGLFGINIHDDVGLGSEASWGCVVAAKDSIEELLSIVARAEPVWGKQLTLTLIDA